MPSGNLIATPLDFRAPRGIRFRLATAALVCALALTAASGANPALSAPAGGPKKTDPAARPDFSAYQRMLDEFLSVISDRGQPIETRFDYMRLHRTSDWGGRFLRVREQLFASPPSEFDERDRRAWAINAYNFLVIQTITENLYEGMHRSLHRGTQVIYRPVVSSVRNIQIDDVAFFDAPLVEIGGVRYSLNTFERHFAFADYDSTSRKPPPPALDPRVHFALVCGSVGCPSLLPRAYRGDSLDRQLDFAVRNALASPTHLRWNNSTNRIEASALFNWYPADFGGYEAALMFVKKYAPASLRKEVSRIKVSWIPGIIPWNWDLNQNLDSETKPSTGARRSG